MMKFYNALFGFALMGLAFSARAGGMPSATTSRQVFQGVGLWAQGLYNYSKQNRTADYEGFRAHTKGMAVGIDGQLSQAMRVGVGYTYADISIDAGTRDIDVDSHQVFLYGEYKPSAWFANWLMGYSYNKYEAHQQNVSEKAHYHTDSYAVALTSGYQFDSGFAPEWGLRYALLNRRPYTESRQYMGRDKHDALTGVLGVHYDKEFKANQCAWTPHANVDLVYDFISDRNEANVSLMPGNSYQVPGRRLHRIGVDFGTGLVFSHHGFDFAIDYRGHYREDFQSHSGWLSLKYRF